MPVDIKLTEDFETQWDEVGDIDTISGTDYTIQCIVVGIVENVDLAPSSLSATDIEEHRGAIEQAVKDNHASSQPITVTVTDISDENQSVTYAVKTAEAEFTVTPL